MESYVLMDVYFFSEIYCILSFQFRDQDKSIKPNIIVFEQGKDRSKSISKYSLTANKLFKVQLNYCQILFALNRHCTCQITVKIRQKSAIPYFSLHFQMDLDRPFPCPK